MIQDITSSYIKSLPQFWKDKKVFITGHTGFKGAWLSLWLELLGAQVIGYALKPPSEPSLFELADLAKGIIHIEGDIRHYDILAKAMNQYQPDIIIHMAAQSLVRYSYQHPVETYETNVLGLVSVLEAVRCSPTVKAVVNVTTDKCYENHESESSYSEDDQLGGHDPYSNSKACSELVTSAYRKSYFLTDTSKQIGLASARAGNVIGGGDWAQDRLIPDIFRAHHKKSSVKIRHLNAIRPWQHVLEPLSGYLLLAQKLFENPLDYAQAWNFGPKDTDVKSVGWVVNELSRLLGPDVNWELNHEPGPHEASVLKLNCAKSNQILGWQPQWDLSKGLEKTVAWYRAYETGENMREFSKQQLIEFMGH
jgi:CDP-glucose 4,6-dehydratase